MLADVKKRGNCPFHGLQRVFLSSFCGSSTCNSVVLAPRNVWLSRRRGASRTDQRKSYDSNKEGDAAPHTDWISMRSLRHVCRNFSLFVARTENITNEYVFKKNSREVLLLTAWPQLFGLDVYAHATK